MKRNYVLIGISALCMLLGLFLAYRWAIQSVEPFSSAQTSLPVTMERVAKVVHDFDEIIPIGFETGDTLEKRTWVNSFYPTSNSNYAIINARSVVGSSIVHEIVCELRSVNDSSRREIVDRLTVLVFGPNQANLEVMEEGATFVSSGWSRHVVSSKGDYLLIKFSRVEPNT